MATNKKNSVLGIRVDRTRVFISPTFMQDPYCCDTKRCDENPTDKHDNVVAASIFNLNLNGEKIIDAVFVSAGERVLVKDQNEKKENGIYIVEQGAWARASDAKTNGQLKKGSYVFVENGAANKNSSYSLVNADPILIGTTELIWNRFSSLLDNEEELATTKVVNSIYEGSESVEILMNPSYFFNQFPQPVSWLYRLIHASKENFDIMTPNHFTNTAISNIFRMNLYPTESVNDGITLVCENGTDEKVGTVWARRNPDKTEIVLRYWDITGVEPFFLFLDYLALPNSEGGGKRLPDGLCLSSYTWSFNHNRNTHDVEFSFGISKVPLGSTLSKNGLLNIPSFPVEPDDWFVGILIKDKVKNLRYEGRFDIKSRTPDYANNGGKSGALDLSLQNYAFGSCENVRLTANFEVNYNYNATRSITVTGGVPPYRFNFYNALDYTYKPAAFHTPANQNPDWFGYWYFEPGDIDPETGLSTSVWKPDPSSKTINYRDYDINSYKTNYKKDQSVNQIYPLPTTNFGVKPEQFLFTQVNENTILFVMHNRGYHVYGHTEHGRWIKQTLKLRVQDSAGNRDEIDININNCTKYEKVWTLDETYYTERVIENGVNEYLPIEEQQYEIMRVYDRSFINAYGTFYFRDTFKPQLVHEYLKYNYCGYGAKPRIVNR
jgi:hypothetical protein